MQKNNVKKFREKIGLSQTELARRTGIANSNLSAIERGHRDAWPLARQRIAEVLGVDEVYLFPEKRTQGDK